MSKFYAVAAGKQPGIYTTWPAAEAQVKGFSGALYKSFPTRELAEAFIANSTHSTTKETPLTTAQADRTLVYTDGGYRSGVAGFGVVIIDRTGNKYTAYGRVPPEVLGTTQTNDVAELYATYVALSLVKDDALLYSDARYVVDSLSTRIHDWVRNGWNGVANRQILESIYNLMQGRKVEFRHVPAHSGYALNEEVDRLATTGLENSEPLVILLNGKRIQ